MRTLQFISKFDDTKKYDHVLLKSQILNAMREIFPSTYKALKILHKHFQTTLRTFQGAAKF